jgi:L-ascorbate metabolism protein UlaG (beta-lactamase superfamily)
MEVLENKLYFDFFYKQFNISLPEIVMYNHRKMFVVNKKCIEINSANELKLLIDEIFSQNPSFDSVFIKKTYWSYGGDKIYKIFPAQVKTDPDMISNLYSEIIKTGFLFQETEEQHPDLTNLTHHV